MLSCFSLSMVCEILACVSSCFCLLFSSLVNQMEANVLPSFFHSFLHVVAIPAHSRVLSTLVVWFMRIAAYSKAMLAMLRLRYLSFRLSALLAFLESGLSSIFPSSFLWVDSSCLSCLISMLFSACSCFFLDFVVVCGVGDGNGAGNGDGNGVVDVDGAINENGDGDPNTA